MKSIYVALSFTHVKTDKEKNMVRSLIKWLETEFGVRIVRWAFDIDEWKPLPCENIYDFDNQCMAEADLVAVFYLTNDGSDGRGGEVVNRTRDGRPIVAFRKTGVRVSNYPKDCLRKAGQEIIEFEDFEELRPYIASALSEIAEKEEAFVDQQQTSLWPACS